MKIYYKGAILLREIEVVIDTEEIANYFFQELTKRGYVPTVEKLKAALLKKRKNMRSANEVYI